MASLADRASRSDGSSGLGFGPIETLKTTQELTLDMTISPAVLVDRVLQTRNHQTSQDAQIDLLKKALDMQSSASQVLLNAVVGDLPLASDGSLGTQVNALV